MKALRSWWRRRFSPEPPPRLNTVNLGLAFGASLEEARRFDRIAAEYWRERWLAGEP